MSSFFQACSRVSPAKVCGWFGSGFGIAGATLLALNIPFSGYAYVFFLISSLVLVVWAIIEKQGHQLAMQAVFSLINIMGIINWLT